MIGLTILALLALLCAALVVLPIVWLLATALLRVLWPLLPFIVLAWLVFR